VFTFPADWGYDCRDYFEPRMPVRFTPSDTSEPPRWLFVTGIAGAQYNELLFADHDSKSYIGRTFSGNGAGVLRTFGTGIILDGDRASVLDPSAGCNETRTNSPAIFARPNSKPIKVGGNAEGRGPNPINASNGPVVIASSAGAQFTLQGGVDFLGSADASNHPLANAGSIGPAFDVNNREPLWNADRQTQFFRPGRGVSEYNAASRDLTFHGYGDPERQTSYDSGTISVNDTAPTATQFKLNVLYAASDEQYYAGRSILFTSGNLVGRVANVVRYGDVSGSGHLTVQGLPAAPTNGSQFKIIGPPVACYRPSDAGTTGWELRRLRRSAVETSYRIRAYAPTGAPVLRVEGGAGNNDHPLSAGWQTIESRLPKSNMADDARGPFLRLTQVGATALYVSWVEVDQNPPVYAGVYTPALTNGANVFDSTPFECQYLRVGNTVTVSGRVDVVPQNPNASTQLRFRLPIPSNLGASEDCSGVASGTAYAALNQVITGVIQPDVTNNEAILYFFSPNIAVDLNMRFHFSYQVIPF
jgi:hypothetical protein